LASTTLTPTHGSKQGLIAPWWHTALLLLILLGASAGQAHTLSATVQRQGRMALYLTTIAFEWALVGLIWMGVRRRGLSIRALVGGRWNTVEDCLLDVALAAGFWFVSSMILAITQFAVGAIKLSDLSGGNNSKLVHDRFDALSFMVPHTGRELLTFAALAATAGVCEEIIYRGYLQRQFGILARSTAVGVLVQAALFGASHGYQGTRMMFVLGVYGALFGLLALWRKSLRPGMMAHAGQDFAAGLALKVLSQFR